MNVNSLENVVVRVESLPDVAFRNINEGYTPGGGQYGQVVETVYAFGGEIEFDRVFGKLGNTVKDPRQAEIELKTMAMAYAFNDYFINGDHATDPKGFEGLKKRAANLPARQTIAFAAADAFDPTASTATARSFTKNWEKAHYRANQGNLGFIAVNEALMWGFADVLRYAQIAGGNWLSLETDAFDREYMAYKGTPMVDMGFKKDQATEIITVTEDPGDAGNDTTSAYFVPVGEEQGLTGIQLGDMEIYDPLSGGERESKPTSLIRIEHWIGLALFGSHGLTRAKHIKDPDLWT